MDIPRMDMPSHNTSDFFKHGSIFDRARDFPVRSFPNSAFFNKTSPAREASPARQVPVFTDASSAVPPQQHQSQPPRGSSQPRQTPSPPTAAQQQQQYQQEQAQRYQQYQQEQQHAAAKQQQQAAHDQPDSQSKPMPPPPPPANDPISKIQKIQRDVLQIFDQVEKFQGTKEGKKDKAYIYLDEMLTQNLLKLDSIDAEDQPQIKSARREAIKSINHCIAVLEAKAEAAGSAATDASESTTNSGEQQQQVPNGTTDRTGSGASLSHSSSNSSSQQQQQTE